MYYFGRLGPKCNPSPECDRIAKDHGLKVIEDATQDNVMAANPIQ